MAHSPVPPPPSAGAGASRFLPLHSPVPSATSSPPDATAILHGLRQAIAGRTRDLDTILGAITEAARFLSGASAAAIAMRRDGVVVCRGRSGDAAPELGARLSMDSGISGECLRTGRTLRCDDTQKDFRVDREVCQRLGLRSIAVVPLRGRHGIMGVLEAFSPRPYAFADEHMAALRQLAELAETARARQFAPPPSPDLEAELEVAPLPTRSWATAVSAGLLRIRGTIATRGRDLLNATKVRRWWVAAGIAGLLAASLGGWRAWHRPVSRSAPLGETAPVTTPAQALETQSGSTAAVSATDLVWTPGTQPRTGLKPSPAMRGVQRAAKVETEVIDTRAASSRALIPDSQALSSNDKTEAQLAGSPPSNPQSAAKEATLLEAPHVVVNRVDGAKLGSAIATTVVMPGFAAPVSQGVSGGILERKVQPVYPAQAMSLRLLGSVVLQATIAEDGTVQDLRVIRGHPILARAAMDAVQQWRYSPYLLNGAPTRMPAQITVTFENQ